MTEADRTAVTTDARVRLDNRLAAAIFPAIIAVLVIWVSFRFVSSYAINLCRWPATLSCDHGTTWVWGVPIVLGAMGAIGVVAVVRWVRHGSSVLHGLAIPAWITVFGLFVAARPTEITALTLAAGTAYGLVGIELARRALAGLVPNRALTVLAAFAIVALLALVLLAPSIFRSAAADEGLLAAAIANPVNL